MSARPQQNGILGRLAKKAGRGIARKVKRTAAERRKKATRAGREQAGEQAARRQAEQARAAAERQYAAAVRKAEQLNEKFKDAEARHLNMGKPTEAQLGVLAARVERAFDAADRVRPNPARARRGKQPAKRVPLVTAYRTQLRELQRTGKRSTFNALRKVGEAAGLSQARIEKDARSALAKGRKANPLQPDADHQVEVSRHYRSGGKSKRQRAIEAGQMDFWGESGNNRAVANPAALVTPADAKKFLKLNVGNRPVDQKKVKAMADLMKRGIYKTTKPITFTNGLLTDGQHRLLAVVASGVPLKTKIARKTIKSNPGILSSVGGGIAGGVGWALAQPIIEEGKKLIRKARKKNGAKRNAGARYMVGREGFDSFLKAVKFASNAGADVVEAATGLVRWTPAPPAPAASRRLYRERKAAHAAQSRAKRNTKRPANVSRLHQDFLGTPNTGRVELLHAPAGVPADVAYLAPLNYIKLANGKTLRFRKGQAHFGGSGGEYIRRLHIGLQNPYDAKGTKNYGEVVEFGYGPTRKPHLYGAHKSKNNPGSYFYHFAGEDNGIRPSLVRVGGLLKFVGGDMKIKREGIAN